MDLISSIKCGIVLVQSHLILSKARSSSQFLTVHIEQPYANYAKSTQATKYAASFTKTKVCV